MVFPPLTPVLLVAGLFLFRSPLTGLVLGGIFTLAAMHLWPDAMMVPYQWIGQGLSLIGLK